MIYPPVSSGASLVGCGSRSLCQTLQRSDLMMRSVTVSLFCLILGSASAFGQSSSQGLQLTGNWSSRAWMSSLSLRLDPVVVINEGEPSSAILPDSAFTDQTRSRIEGVALYNGTGLYSAPFEMHDQCRSLQIPISYAAAFAPVGKSKTNPSAVVFLDITDKTGRVVLARMLGHQAVSPESDRTDSSLSLTATVSEHSSLWNLEGRAVAFGELLGRTVRVRLTLATDPVVPQSAISVGYVDAVPVGRERARSIE